MACNIVVKAIAYDCATNLSGVKKIYVNDYNNVDVTPTAGGKATIALVQPKEEGQVIPKFEELSFAKNTASYTSTLTKNEAQGTKYYNTELVANFNKLTADKNAIFNGSDDGAGLDGGQLIFLVVDKNNHTWIIGGDDYATTTALTAQTGAGVDDGNFYTLTVTAQSGTLPYEVEDIASVIA